ncbi:MAG: hypothetical protein ACREEX_00750 [Caulobacteraceae bacterium]
MSVETLDFPTAATAPGSILAPAKRARLLTLAGLIVLLTSFAAPWGGVLGVPIFFILKNRLHLSLQAIAAFNLVAGIPLYLSFLFGLLRDRWSPFGLGDKGHYLVFGLAGGLAYGLLAFAPPAYGVLLAGVIVASALVLVPTSAANGLFSELGQDHAMTGQSGAVLAAGLLFPLIVGYFFGGLISGALEGRDALAAIRALFGLGAVLMGSTALFGILAPRELTRGAKAPSRRLGAELGALFRTRAAWPPVLILFLWNVAPAFGVVMQMHMAADLRAADSQVGAFYGIYYAACIPPILFYGWLCQRVRLKTLLFWAAVAGVPSMLPLLLARTAAAELLMAVPVGLMSGFTTAACFHLAVRSCPRALEGMMMTMAVATSNFVATRIGDVLGAWLAQLKGGFLTADLVGTATYALMIPVLFLVPRYISESTEGAPADYGR